MKIAMIGHKDFPCRSGGVEVVVPRGLPRAARTLRSITAADSAVTTVIVSRG